MCSIFLEFFDSKIALLVGIMATESKAKVATLAEVVASVSETTTTPVLIFFLL